VFRLHVGSALIRRHGWEAQYPQWGLGQSADAATVLSEQPLERLVTEYVGKLRCLVLSINDEASGRSDRAFVEQAIIGLLTPLGISAVPPSTHWLGLSSSRDIIRRAGLWNINHVGAGCPPRLFEVLEHYVDLTTTESWDPAPSITTSDDWAGFTHGSGEVRLF
jgi:hypothetical protein